MQGKRRYCVADIKKEDGNSLKRFGLKASKPHSKMTPKEWFETYGSNPN